MISNILKKARTYEKDMISEIPKEQRPVFHISAPIGWINDPNGFSFFKGEYHLFYQYYPYDINWNSMHWGHSKSSDFVKWEYLPTALAPDEDYDSFGVFSGTAMEDNGRHVLLYTGVSETELSDGTKEIHQNQCVAVGNGMDYEKAPENPVITSDMLPAGSILEDFRDPKVWKEDGRYYAVTGGRNADGSGQIALFSSDNLKKWEFCTIFEKCENRYGKMWECPDFFPLGEQHILLVSPQDMMAEGLEFHNGNGTMFLKGFYDKEQKNFSRKNVQAVDYGLDFYAPQTMETQDGRRVMIAWMKSWDAHICIEGAKWSGMMTFPRELSIKEGRVIQNPVKEIERYYKNPVSYEKTVLQGETRLAGISGRSLDFWVETERGSCGRMEICLAQNDSCHTSVVYDFAESLLTFDRTYSGMRRDFNCIRSMAVKHEEGRMKIRILLDKYSVEIFTNGGESALTAVIPTPVEADGILFRVHGRVCADVRKFDIVV